MAKDGKSLFVGSSCGGISQWEVGSDRNVCTGTWQTQQGELTLVRCRGDRIITCGNAPHVRIWESYYDGKVTVRNLDYNYNWHDADWKNLANSGGYDRYIVETDSAGSETLIHDETGSNTGVRIYKNQVADDVWSSYDPKDGTGTIEWDKVTDIQYEVRSNESIKNEYRGDDRQWQSSNAQTQYFQEVVDDDGQSQGWSEFVGDAS